MGLLARKPSDDDQGGTDLGLTLDTLRCPVCRRELPPWIEVCPDDGAGAVRLGDLPSTGGPPVPSHLLDDLGDGVADENRDDRHDRNDSGLGA
jgi:hypothetical protein